MRRPSKTPGISRIDQPSHRTHGFFVRVHHRGKIHSAFFSDQKHGGRKRALEAAQKHYLKLRKRLRLPSRASRRWNAEVVRRKGKSGIQGVQRVIIRRPDGWKSKVWMAIWSPEAGVVRKAQFSIGAYGEQRAKQLAIRARRAGVRSMK